MVGPQARSYVVRVYRAPGDPALPDGVVGVVVDTHGRQRAFHTAAELLGILTERREAPPEGAKPVAARIRRSVEALEKFYAEHPEKAVSADKPAVAVVEEGLRCRAVHPDGSAVVSDMPQGVGGGGSAPTPGWLLRAALANCDATVIAMRAARLGVELTQLEVTAESRSDSRGMLGPGEAIPAGPLDVRLRVRLAAANASAEALRGIVAWAEAHSPVGDALRRAVPCRMEVEIA